MTNKEKYNNLSSIDIYSLSQEELKIAIHEWAEGDSIMEELLWKCYKSGVETKQCHAGGRPFIQVSADRNANKVKNMINSVCDVDGFSILITPDGGGPFSGDTFYKAGLCIAFLKTMYEDEAGELFKKMINSLDLENNSSTKMTDSLIDLYNFFREKESDIDFRLVFKDGKYRFNVESSNKRRQDQYNNIFISAGLTYDSTFYCPTWFFEADNLEELGNRLETVAKIIISSYSFEIPDRIEEDMSFNEYFRVLRRKFVERDGNDLLYREFISHFYTEFEQARQDYYDGKIEDNVAATWLIDSLRAVEKEVTSDQSLN